MDKVSQERFEQALKRSLKKELGKPKASAALKQRLLCRLGSVEKEITDANLSDFERFQESLSGKITESLQRKCASDECLLKVELALSKESGRSLVSQSSVRTAGNTQDPKTRFVSAFDLAVARSIQTKKASSQCKARIEAALTKTLISDSKAVVASPAPRRSFFKLQLKRSWKKGLTAVASLAACTVIVFTSLLGGAQKALADSVRKDHVQCCVKLASSSSSHCSRLKDSKFGQVPNIFVAQGWQLISSGICTSSSGQAMVHNVYRDQQKTLSLHLMPPSECHNSPSNDKPQEIADDNFPVFAWCRQGWTITACSKDLDASQLALAIGGSKP